MTKPIRRGLLLLAEFGRSWLEADSWETPEGMDADGDNGGRNVADLEAALAYVEKGGLS